MVVSQQICMPLERGSSPGRQHCPVQQLTTSEWVSQPGNKTQSIWQSSTLSIYGAETWPVSTQMNQLINSFATSAYRIMTGVKRSDKVRNTMVLRSVSRNDLIHTVHDRQLRFLGHMLRNTHSPHASIIYVQYQPTHGTTRRGRPQLNYMDYIEKLTGMKVNELLEVSQDREAWRELVVVCVDLQPLD